VSKLMVRQCPCSTPPHRAIQTEEGAWCEIIDSDGIVQAWNFIESESIVEGFSHPCPDPERALADMTAWRLTHNL
jgi:hypothetical protein